MPTETIIIVSGVVAAFALFAAGLAFTSITSSK
jgi:hypothetical protein